MRGGDVDVWREQMKELMSKAGEKWRELSEEVKTEYNDKVAASSGFRVQGRGLLIVVGLRVDGLGVES